MNKRDVIRLIHENFVVAVVRANSLEANLAYAKAYVDGGVKVLEVSAESAEPYETIRQLKKLYGDNVIVGAGTVLDDVTARLMMFSGADFMAAPTFSSEVAIMCNRYQKFYLPTCFTSNEIAQAMGNGIDTVKMFPGELCPASVTGVLQKMYSGLNIMTAGGADYDNIEDWLRIGIWAVGLVLPADDLQAVTANSKAFIDKVNKLKC